MHTTFFVLVCVFHEAFTTSPPPVLPPSPVYPSVGAMGTMEDIPTPSSETTTLLNLSSVTTAASVVTTTPDSPHDPIVTIPWDDDIFPSVNATLLPSCRCSAADYTGNSSNNVYCETAEESYYDYDTYACIPVDGSSCISEYYYADAQYCTRRDLPSTSTEVARTVSPSPILSSMASTDMPPHVTQFQHGCYDASDNISSQLFCFTSVSCSVDVARLNSALRGLYFACVGFNVHTKYSGLGSQLALDYLNNHTRGAPFRCSFSTRRCCQVACRVHPSDPSSCWGAVQQVNTFVANASITNPDILSVSPFTYVPTCNDGNPVPFPTCLQSCCAPRNMTFGNYGNTSQGMLVVTFGIFDIRLVRCWSVSKQRHTQHSLGTRHTNRCGRCLQQESRYVALNSSCGNGYVFLDLLTMFGEKRNM